MVHCLIDTRVYKTVSLLSAYFSIFIYLYDALPKEIDAWYRIALLPATLLVSRGVPRITMLTSSAIRPVPIVSIIWYIVRMILPSFVMPMLKP